MHRVVAVLVLAGLAGCTKRQQDFAWFAAAVAIEVAQAASEHESERRPRGVAVAAPDPDHAPPPSRAELDRARGVAIELTRIAAHDARTENCDAVVRTSKHVHVIDPDVFATVFLTDVEIQRCLALAP